MNPSIPPPSPNSTNPLVPPSKSDTPRFWPLCGGAVTMVGVALAVEGISRKIVPIPNPGAIYLIVVAYTAVKDGRRAALLAALVAFAAGILLLSVPKFSFVFPPASLSRLAIMAFSLLALALIAGGAKAKSDILLAERVAREAARTENERAQAILRASEERLRLAHEAAQIGTWDFFPLTGTFEWDEMCRDMYGIAPGKPVTYERWEVGIHPDDKDRVVAARKNALQGNGVYELEYRSVGVDFPAPKWLAVSGKVFYDGENRPVRFLGVVQDITERKHAEEILRRRESEFVAVVENAPDIITRLGPDLRHVYINRAIEDATGLPPSHYLGKTARELSSPENADRVGPWEELLRGVFASGESAMQEAPYRHRDGTVHTLQIRIVPEFDGSDHAVTSLLTVGRDVTEKERAASMLRESLQTLSEALEAKEAIRAALQVSEARARRVINAPLVGIINWNLDTDKITDANDTFLAFTGYTRSDIESGLMDFQAMTPPEWRARNDEGVQTIRTQRFTPPYEKEYFHKDGRRVPVVIGGALFDDSDCEGVSFVVDITERKLLENERDAMLKKQQRIAETLQHSLLIATPPGAFPGLELAEWYEAAWDDALIGGDFYDAFALDGDKVAVVVGDATGKGLKAAAQTAEVKFALRAFLRESGNAGEALKRLNHFLLQAQAFDNRLGDALVCVSLAIIDPKTGAAQIAAGGMEPPLLLPKQGSPLAVPVGGPIVGMNDRAVFDTAEITLLPGDVLLLATDGITEARQKIGGRAFFGYDGFARSSQEALRDSVEPGEAALKRGGEQIVSDAKRFAGGTLHDDVCLLLVRLRPSNS